MSEGRKQALEYVCQHGFTLQFMVYGGTVGLLLDVAALLTLDPNSAAHTVALLNLPGLLFFVTIAAVALWMCLNS